MSNAIQNFEIIYNNPFILTPLFHSFYKEISGKPKNVLLSYLLLPLVLPEKSKKFLIRANSRSSILTLVKDRQRIFGIAERIYEYRELTNACLQNAFDIRSMTLSEDQSISVKNDYSFVELSPHGTLKAASKLGRLFSPFEIAAIFRMLGVKQL